MNARVSTAPCGPVTIVVSIGGGDVSRARYPAIRPTVAAPRGIAGVVHELERIVRQVVELALPRPILDELVPAGDHAEVRRHAEQRLDEHVRRLVARTRRMDPFAPVDQHGRTDAPAPVREERHERTCRRHATGCRRRRRWWVRCRCSTPGLRTCPAYRWRAPGTARRTACSPTPRTARSWPRADAPPAGIRCRTGRTPACRASDRPAPRGSAHIVIERTHRA